MCGIQTYLQHNVYFSSVWLTHCFSPRVSYSSGKWVTLKADGVSVAWVWHHPPKAHRRRQHDFRQVKVIDGIVFLHMKFSSFQNIVSQLRSSPASLHHSHIILIIKNLPSIPPNSGQVVQVEADRKLSQWWQKINIAPENILYPRESVGAKNSIQNLCTWLRICAQFCDWWRRCSWWSTSPI